MAGSYGKRKIDVTTIKIEDFCNPFDFFAVLNLSDKDFYPWLMSNGLLASEEKFKCPKCGGDGKLGYRATRRIPYLFRCKRNINHDFSVTKNSFFENSKIDIRNIFVFIRSYIYGASQWQCSTEAGINYGSTAGVWANFIRDVFVEVVSREYSQIVLQGEVEVDEALFGTELKHRKKTPSKNIWIFGIIERATNKLVMVPVSNRDESTLVAILNRFVAPGTRIFSNGFASSCNLKNYGFQHSTLLRKTNHHQTYLDTLTNEEVFVQTTTFMGAWVQAKGQLKKLDLFGNKGSNFESHFCEVLWRNWRKGSNTLKKFFDDLKTFYPLDGPCTYAAKRPIFGDWIASTEFSSPEDYSTANTPDVASTEFSGSEDNTNILDTDDLESVDSDEPYNFVAVEVFVCEDRDSQSQSSVSDIPDVGTSAPSIPQHDGKLKKIRKLSIPGDWGK